MDKELNYIYSYIKYMFFNVSELKDNKYLLDLSRRIKNSMPNSNFNSGDLDFYINNFIDNEMDMKKSESYSRYKSLKNYIYLSIEYYRMYYGRNIQNKDVVIREIMKEITSKYSLEEILEGKCESEIETLIDITPDIKFIPKDEISRVPLDVEGIMYDKSRDIDDRTFIKKYIEDYLKGIESVFVFKGDIINLVNYICIDICRNNIKADDLLAGEYDSIIDSYINGKMFGIEYTSNFSAIHSIVSRFVRNNHTYMNIGNIEQNISEEAFNLSKYLIKSGYDLESIKSGKYDDIMESHLRLDCLKANSKVCKNSKLEGKNPNKFFLNSKQLYDDIKKPIIIAVALGIIGTSVAFSNQNDTQIKEDIEVFDTYDYPNIPYTMSDEFAEALEHIVDYYDGYESYGKGYGQICLYRVYQSIKGGEKEKTYAMDIMFALIKSRAKDLEDMQRLYRDVKTYQSYVEYVCDRVKNNGSYIKAAHSYASQVANYKELHPFSLISSDEQRAIKNMMDSYGKYIDILEIEFNKVTRDEREK